MSVENEVMAVKKALSQAKSEYDKLQGSIESSMQQLSDAGLSSIQEAKAKVVALNKEIDDLSKTIDAKLPEIKEALSKWM
jgi:peptidoglycan hydrolase CwlO-like protein